VLALLVVVLLQVLMVVVALLLVLMMLLLQLSRLGFLSGRVVHAGSCFQVCCVGGSRHRRVRASTQAQLSATGRQSQATAASVGG